MHTAAVCRSVGVSDLRGGGRDVRVGGYRFDSFPSVVLPLLDMVPHETFVTRFFSFCCLSKRF